MTLANAFAARQEEFARLLTEKGGKPLPHAAIEVTRSIDVIRYFASLDLPLKVVKEDEKQKIFQQNAPRGRCRNHTVELRRDFADDQGSTGAPCRKYGGHKACANDSADGAPVTTRANDHAGSKTSI